MASRVSLPKKAALLAEALRLLVENPEGKPKTYSLRGRLLGTDAGRRRLFAIRPARAVASQPPGRSGQGVASMRRDWQGAPVDRWLCLQTEAPRHPVYLGTARRIFYRSDKQGGKSASYFHDFSSPAPAVYRAGPNFFLVGGKKRLTARGIEH